jgi:hypothetical protein
MKSKLRVDVNKNPTKTGIKVQFVLPQALEGDKKAEATQKLQSKLNQGLEQYNLTVSQDTDVPYSNVIGFLIPIADIKLLIKNAIGGEQAEPTPEETPEEAPAEEPVKEVKRMQKLAGLINEDQKSFEEWYNELVQYILDSGTSRNSIVKNLPKEVKGYWEAGLTPEQVFNDEWFGDAGYWTNI